MKKSKFKLLFSSIVLSLVLLLSVANPFALAIASDTNRSSAITYHGQVLDSGKWAPNTYKAINNLIQENRTHNSKRKPYAVFDWDNTSIFQDTTDNVLNYQINNLKYKMTPEQFEYSFTHGDNKPIPQENFVEPYKNVNGQSVNIYKLSIDVVSDYKYFWAHYKGLNPNADGTLSDIAAVQATDQFKDFKAKIWFAYSALIDTFGEDVAYTWQLNMFVGYTPDELIQLCNEGIAYYLAEKIQNVYFDSPATLPGIAGEVKNSVIGNYFTQGLRIIPEMSNLMNTLRKNGIDVYISTAAMDTVVRSFASNPLYGYNVPEANVLGLRLKVDNAGRYKAEIPDKKDYAINVKHGKAYNINKYLVPKYRANPILICGDSSGDYEMMTELSGFNNVKMINDKEPVKMVLISNRIKGEGLGELSKIAVSQLGTPNPSIVLQGRNENTGLWIPDERTLRLGKTSLQLTK
ncbi:haloacid dehalogenase-like hydrolase [Bacillus salipaludis]|uniref:phosphoserine phosphatase n=1 Tax=Bacillus salipaludis TaxID=2547811 RepID=A0A4R5VK71_9BACI|nr:haloacid dehalogenase-like hydrolase [Bacillus salipaludis]TDK56199.1 haloacid dehalogenase-like hydrolase [Bacillus salipaludis]